MGRRREEKRERENASCTELCIRVSLRWFYHEEQGTERTGRTGSQEQAGGPSREERRIERPQFELSRGEFSLTLVVDSCASPTLLHSTTLFLLTYPTLTRICKSLALATTPPPPPHSTSSSSLLNFLLSSSSLLLLLLFLLFSSSSSRR